jgi:purine nucleoside phosphorylase
VRTGRLALITGTGVGVDDVAPVGDDHVIETRVEPVTVRDLGTMVVLARHGLARRPAHRVDHLVNLTALQSLGCDRILAVASAGSLRPDWPVGTVVLPDDFFGPWVTPSRFADARGHTVPGFDLAWRARVLDAWRATTTTPIQDGGVYVQTTGPRFETPAEIRFFATVGDVVGMTVATECVLARELGLAYAAVCTVDNLANGVDDIGLTLEEFQAGVARNRPDLVADVQGLAHALETGAA